MDRVVLDSSAVVALLYDEPGSAVVQARLRGAVICTVNLAEVGDFLVRSGAGQREGMERAIAALDLSIRDPDAALALDVSELLPLTRPAGLSLGDRFCLALAKRLGRPVLTGDRIWREIADAVGVDVELIR